MAGDLLDPGGGDQGALGPLGAMWRDVYRKAGAVAEARTTDLLKYHVYVYHPAAGAAAHTHYLTVQGLWRFLPDPGATPATGQFATETGSILDATTLAFHRTTAEAQIIPGVAGVLRPGDHVHVMARDDLTRYARYTVRAPLEGTETAFTVPVTLVAAGTAELLPDAPCWVTFLLGAAGGGAAGTTVVCQVSESGSSGNELVSDVSNPIMWDTEDWDPAGFHSGLTPTRITVPPGWAGWYRFHASLPTDMSNSDPTEGYKEYFLSLWINGGGAAGHCFEQSGPLPANTTQSLLYATPFQPLAEGDYVELLLWHNCGTTKYLNTLWSNPPRMTVERYGPPPESAGAAVDARLAALEARLNALEGA